MADRGPEVDWRAAAARGVERGHVRDADLQVERGRYAVLHREPIRGGVIDVRVEVDEARRDHQPARVERLASAERRGGHGRDAAARDPDIAHRVEVRLGIDDPPAADDEIEGGLLRPQGEGDRGQDAQRREKTPHVWQHMTNGPTAHHKDHKVHEDHENLSCLGDPCDLRDLCEGRGP
jgi:hypothetical protein